jgi:hypothetical protein
MTTQIVQKKHVHLNILAKNQGRAAALPCSTVSFALERSSVWVLAADTRHAE